MTKNKLFKTQEACEEETVGNSDDDPVYYDDDFEGFTFQ